MKKALRTFIFVTAYLLLLAPVLGVIGWFANNYLDERAGKKFDLVKLNDTEAAVNKLMGRPDKERPCGENLWWGGNYVGKNDGRCVTEVRYEYFLSAWAIGYSGDKHVVDKYHYFSE